jgi:deazaflavin-dependent oxidoreductase (nitroreductase family)
VPSFWVIETYRNMGPAIIPMMGIGILSGAIVLTWLYIGSGGSIWIIALWHLALNFGSATTAGRGVPGMVVWNGMLLWAIVVVVGWAIAGEPRTRPFLTRLRDGSLIAILRSPMGRLFGGMTVITFRARRTGRTLSTPVECVYEPGHLFVLVGHPEQKQWWRNVSANPEVTVEIDGHEVPGRATVHVGDDAGAEDDLASYLRHRPRVAHALGLPPNGALDRAALSAAAEQAVSVRIDVQPAAAG